jgi:hypothetical protein
MLIVGSESPIKARRSDFLVLGDTGPNHPDAQD